MNARPGLGVGDEVELAVAMAGLDIGEPVVLVGRRAQRLGQQRKAVDAQRQLAAARDERGAVDPDEIPEVQRQQAFHLLGAQHVDLRLQLDASRAVLEVQEGHLALAPPGGEAPRYAMGDLGLLARLQAFVGGADGRDRLDPVELMRERVDAGRS